MKKQSKIAFSIILLLLFLPLTHGTHEKTTQTTSSYPVGFWSFNNVLNNTVPDDSGDNLTGTLVNTSISVGVTGNGTYFNGNNSYMKVNDSPILHMSVLSVSLWFKPTVFNTYAKLIGKGSGAKETFGIFINQTKPDQYMLYTGYGLDISGSGYFTFNNEWHQVVYVFNKTSDVFYLDGSQLGQGFGIRTPLQNNTDLLVVGGDLTPTGFQDPFNGSIDQVRIYNQALTSEDVFAIYLAEKNSNTTSPLLNNS